MSKIEKIRQKIKRLKSTNPSEYNYQNAEGYIWALNDLLSFLDTLEEEPDKSLDDEISRTYHDGSVADTSDLDHTSYENIARHFAEWGAEHIAGVRKMIDKNLEEAAEGYAREKQEHHIDFDGDEYLDYGPRYDAFIAGAQWQEKRNEETIKTAEDHAFLAGADWQKEQFEKNRLAHCDALSKEDCDRETDFAMEIIEKEHRQPTFDDAINYGMRLQKDALMEWLDGKMTIEGATEGFVGGYDSALKDVIEHINKM